MRVRARRRKGGFWKGLATGLLVACVVALALAWFFPPIRYFAPAIPGGAGEAPEAPNRPALVPSGPVVTEDAAGPLVPGVGPPPAAPNAAPPVRDTEGNTPSLVPLE
ncbi:hypothetical protein [Amaricoccus sp. W119]|uniref:hypothetical protein n=1 Tax=Amaricoccus sp. W119 TaxID=3391833 RepID=UPI0039A5FED1